MASTWPTEFVDISSPQQAKVGPEMTRGLAYHCMAKRTDTADIIMIIGGWLATQPTGRTSTYDVSKKSWNYKISGLNDARSDHGCASLASGLVIVGGGFGVSVDGSSGWLDSVEIFINNIWNRGKLRVMVVHSNLYFQVY